MGVKLNCIAFYYTVPCVWLEWSEWSTCSVSCGEGIEERTRGQIPAQHGGKSCVGDSVETTPCSNDPCPSEILHYNTVYTIYMLLIICIHIIIIIIIM